MLTSFLGGFHTVVFAQPSSNSITSSIEESEQKLNDSLEEGQQKIGYIDDGLLKVTDMDVKWVLFFTDLFTLD